MLKPEDFLALLPDSAPRIRERLHQASWREAARHLAGQQAVRADGLTFTRDAQGRELVLLDPERTRSEFWRRLLEGTGFPPLLDVAKLDKPQAALLAKLVKRGRACNVALSGRQGVGKTALALLALRQLCADGLRVGAWEWERFKVQSEPAWRDAHPELPAPAQQAQAPAVLLLDDVGFGDSGHAPSEHERRLLLELVRARDALGRWTWITTNLSWEGLAAYGDAVTTRLIQPGRDWFVQIHGASFRVHGPAAQAATSQPWWAE